MARADVLYDREKPLSVGGFSWWHRLPPRHAGEEVVVQFLLIRKYGGCVPDGARTTAEDTEDAEVRGGERTI